MADPPSARPAPDTGRRAVFSRRGFLRSALIGGLVALATEAIAVIYVRLFPRRAPIFGSRIEAGRLADLAVGAAPRRVVAGKLFLARFPVGVLAIYWRCRHLGCDVPWHSSETVETPWGERVTGVFRCPCHDSVYTRDGQVIAGPAPGPLDIFTVEVERDGRIVVDTGEIWRRPAATVDDLTPARPAASGPPNREHLTRVGAAP